MYPHKVKIIRNYNSKNMNIQEEVPAYIKSDLSFFDNDTDIKRGDYVFLPGLDEPRIVEEVKVQPRGIGVYIKEVRLIPESEISDNSGKDGTIVNGDFQGFSNVITLNNVNASLYLDVIMRSIEDSEELHDKQRKILLKKLDELRNDPYIETLKTNLSLPKEKLKGLNLKISY